MTTPLAMPTGVFWQARMFKSFVLTSYPRIECSASSFVAGGGLSVAPHLTMGAIGHNAGKFTLAATPLLEMLPQGFQMRVTPSIGMSGSPCYAINLGVTPSLSMRAIPDMAFNLSATPNISVIGFAPPPTFDAAAGTTGEGTQTWTHTAAAGAYVLVDAISADGTVVMAATYNSQPMITLGSVGLTGGTAGNGFITRFGIANVAGGANTVTVTNATSASSVSYINVKSFGATVSNSGTGQTGSQIDTPGSGQTAVQVFGAYDSNTISQWSSTSGGASRYNQSSTATTYLAVRDSTASAAFSATSSDATSGSCHWGGLCTMLSSAPFPSVSYDATGAGAKQSSGTPHLSWSHTIGSSANALLVGLHSNLGTSSTVPPSDITCKVGGVAMTQLVALPFGESFHFVFGLLNPPTGSQTIQVQWTIASGQTSQSAVNSVSYSGVQGFGIPMTQTTGFTSSLSQSVGAPLAPMVFQMFGNDGGTSALSGYSQTQRWNEFTSGTDFPTVIGDAVGGTNNISFAASIAGALSSSGAVAIPLI